MTLNWKSDADYAYLAELDTKGWAWEFIRRSPAYREAYQEISALPNEQQTAKSFYFPEKNPNESDVAWRMRVDEQMGMKALKVTRGAYLALKQWSLRDLYSPEQIYDASVIKYYGVNPYPAFFVNPDDWAEGKQNAITDEKTLKNLYHPNTLWDGPLVHSSAVTVVFDMRLPVKAQIEKARSFLNSIGDAYDKKDKGTSINRNDWVMCIRFLDALLQEEKVTHSHIVRTIDKRPSTQGADASTVANIAETLKRKAYRVLDEGIYGLIYEIQNT